MTPSEVTLTREQKDRIESLAASFVEDSNLLMGLADSMRRSVKLYMEEEQRQKVRR